MYRRLLLFIVQCISVFDSDMCVNTRVCVGLFQVGDHNSDLHVWNLHRHHEVSTEVSTVERKWKCMYAHTVIYTIVWVSVFLYRFPTSV